MNPNIPTSPFTTRLSGSAKETELRLRNIFQWKKKRPPIPLFLLTAVLVLSCCGLVSCQVEEKEPPVEDTTPTETKITSTGKDTEPTVSPDAEPAVSPVETAPKVYVGVDPDPTHYDPMGQLTQEQKDLLANLPVDELPRQAVDMHSLRRSHFWRNTLLPFAHNAEYDITFYGVVSSESPFLVSSSSYPSELITDGIVVRVGDRAVYTPIPWYDNAYFSGNPWMELNDFDGDGQVEAALCTHCGRGTGVSVSALFLFDLDTLTYTVPDYTTLDIDVSYDPVQHTAALSAGEHTVTVSLESHLEPLEEVSSAYIVDFSYEDGQIYFHTGLDFSGYTTGYLVQATAPVIWNGSGYCLGPVTALTAY